MTLCNVDVEVQLRPKCLHIRPDFQQKKTSNCIPRPLSVLFCRAWASTTADDAGHCPMNGSIGVPPYMDCMACIIARAPSAFPPTPQSGGTPVWRTSSASIISYKNTFIHSFIHSFTYLFTDKHYRNTLCVQTRNTRRQINGYNNVMIKNNNTVFI